MTSKISSGNSTAASVPFVWKRFKAKVAFVRLLQSSFRSRASWRTAPVRCCSWMRFNAAKAAVQQQLQKGILIKATQEKVLRFLPPYIIQKKHVDEVVRALDSALSASAAKRPPTRAGKTTKRSLR